MKPHILYLCSEYPPSPGGGIGTMYQTTAKALTRSGWRVTVGGIYNNVDRSTYSDDEGVSVCRLPASKRTRGRYYLNMFLDRIRLGRWADQQVRCEGVSIIEAADYMGWMYGVTAPVPRITRLHGADILFQPLLGHSLNRVKAHIETTSLRRSTRIVASSDYMAKLVQPWLQPGRQVDTAIYNMVDVDTFHPEPSVVRDPYLVASVATITPKKGVFQLLDAWRIVHKQVPDARLVFYGRDMPDSKGSVIERLQQKIHTYGLNRCVSFGGVIPYNKLRSVFLETGIIVFPSYIEAHPRAWLEAMATGVPVIGSIRGPGPEVIDNERTGLLVDPDDVPQIANAILDLLNNPAKAAALGQAARQSMVERLSFDVILKKNIDFYLQCISEMRQ